MTTEIGIQYDEKDDNVQYIQVYSKVQPILNVAGRWQRFVPELCRREFRFLVRPHKADCTGAQRCKGRNPAKRGAGENPGGVCSGGRRSLCQCVCGKSAANRAFFLAGLGTLPSIKSQSIFFNEQHKQR